jgi:NADH-quinone oxidoreductase subunit A
MVYAIPQAEYVLTLLREGKRLKEAGIVIVQYIPFVILFIVAVAFSGGALLISRLGPHNPNPKKQEPYESGMVPIGTTHGRFPIRFYLVALLFILFDIEIIFLYPWAVILMKEPTARLFLFFEVLAFIGVLAVGYIYIWRKGAIDWD